MDAWMYDVVSATCVTAPNDSSSLFLSFRLSVCLSLSFFPARSRGFVYVTCTLRSVALATFNVFSIFLRSKTMIAGSLFKKKELVAVIFRYFLIRRFCEVRSTAADRGLYFAGS